MSEHTPLQLAMITDLQNWLDSLKQKYTIRDKIPKNTTTVVWNLPENNIPREWNIDPDLDKKQMKQYMLGLLLRGLPNGRGMPYIKAIIHNSKNNWNVAEDGIRRWIDFSNGVSGLDFTVEFYSKSLYQGEWKYETEYALVFTMIDGKCFK